MISVTHFMDRDGQVLADVTPRRYFCTECHVPQSDARPPVPNTFTDMGFFTPRPTGLRDMARLKALLIWFWAIASDARHAFQPRASWHSAGSCVASCSGARSTPRSN